VVWAWSSRGNRLSMYEALHKITNTITNTVNPTTRRVPFLQSSKFKPTMHKNVLQSSRDTSTPAGRKDEFWSFPPPPRSPPPPPLREVLKQLLQGGPPWSQAQAPLPLPPVPPQLRPVALQARAEARARAEAWGYVAPQAVARMEALAQALGEGVWPVKAHTFTYDDVLADSKLMHLIYSIPDYRLILACHLYRRPHTTQKYWWLIQITTPITRLPPELLYQILLFIIDEASDSPLALMLVCKHWYDIVTGIWASLKLGTTTPKDAVTTKLRRNQLVLDVVVDTEIDSGHLTPPEGAYQAIFAAIEATDRWRSFVVETFPPQADLPEHLVNSGLQRCSEAVMNRIRTFRIKCACETSPLLDHLLRILGKSASRELTTVEINSPNVISFLTPTYSTIFHYVKVLSLCLDTPGLRNPVDLLPHLHQLESLTASHLSFPNDVDLPFVHTLRHLSLRGVSIQWMSGKTFHALESCTLLLPRHCLIQNTFSTTLPNCKHLTFQGYPLDVLNGVSARNLDHLSVTCSSSFGLRGTWELVQFSSQALRQSRLSPRILHLSIEATSEAWRKALAFMSDLEELVIENTRPSSLGAKVLRSLVVHPIHTHNSGTTATPGGRNAPLCPSLKRLGLRYRRWLRPNEPFNLIPEFRSIILSRQRSEFPLQSFQIWIRSDEKDPLELIDGLSIGLKGFERLMDVSAIGVSQAMASKLVENMEKPSGKSSTTLPQRPLLPRTPPAPPPLPNPVSSRSLTVLVRHPYEDQMYKEINLIEGEFIYDVEQFDDKWWRGTTMDGKRGVFPASHVEESATPDEAEVLLPLLPVRPAPKIRIPTAWLSLVRPRAEDHVIPVRRECQVVLDINFNELSSVTTRKSLVIPSTAGVRTDDHYVEWEVVHLSVRVFGTDTQSEYNSVCNACSKLEGKKKGNSSLVDFYAASNVIKASNDGMAQVKFSFSCYPNHQSPNETGYS